jgi:hypothetical protein
MDFNNPLVRAAAELKPQASLWLTLANIRTVFEIVFYVISETLRLALLAGLIYLIYYYVPWTTLLNQIRWH